MPGLPAACLAPPPAPRFRRPAPAEAPAGAPAARQQPRQTLATSIRSQDGWPYLHFAHLLEAIEHTEFPSSLTELNAYDGIVMVNQPAHHFHGIDETIRQLPTDDRAPWRKLFSPLVEQYDELITLIESVGL